MNRQQAKKLERDRLAGISIGAVNGAIIAGSPPELRVEVHAAGLIR